MHGMRYVVQISSTVGTLLIIRWQALDIQDISRVVGFMVLKSLSNWIRRSGCAGRSSSPANFILLESESEDEDDLEDEFEENEFGRE